MRTEIIQICKFEELSKEAQEIAVKEVRERLDHYFIWDEAHETVKEFHDLFGTKEGLRSWLDIRTGHIDDNIIELTGVRLRTYIINNFGWKLFKRKYLGHSKAPIGTNCNLRPHKMKSFRRDYKGATHCFYYSNIQKTTDYVLTGVCYDHSVLKPIYDFIKKPDSSNFQELLEDCFYSLKKDIEQEVEYRESEEGIIEEIESGDIEFYEDGTIY